MPMWQHVLINLFLLTLFWLIILIIVRHGNNQPTTPEETTHGSETDTKTRS